MPFNKKTLKNAFERIIIITLFSLFLAALLLSVVNDIYAFVGPSGAVLISVEAPTTLYRLSQELSRNGVINNPAVFCLYIRSKGRADRLESFSGDVVLNRDMNYREIMLALS